MNYEVAFCNGKVYATFKSPEMLRKFIGVVEDCIKSEVFNANWESAGDLITFLLDLKEAQKESKHKEAEEDDIIWN